jgi:cyclohexadieny/prephenate dehydrogenase
MAPLLDRIAIIGIGLIGSSIARAVREHHLAGHIAIADADDGDAVEQRCHPEVSP